MSQPEITQIILVEDGSTDGSLEICRQLAVSHPSITLLRHPNGENKGAPASRNLGLSQVINPWIQFMDSDDELLPGKIADQLQVIKGHECLVIGEFTNVKNKPEYIRPRRDIWVGLLTTRLGNSVANLWNTHWVKAAGGWNESLPNVQEYHLMLEILKRNPNVSFSNQNLTLVYPQPNSISNSPKKKKKKLDTYFTFRSQVKNYLLETGSFNFLRWHYYTITTGEMMRYHQPSMKVRFNKGYYGLVKKLKTLKPNSMHVFFRSGLGQRLFELAYFYKDKFRGFPKIKSVFKKMNGYPLDLDQPVTHNQRIVHKMVTDRNPLLVITSDKVAVRDFVKAKLGAEQAEKILIPHYFVSQTGRDIPQPSWDFEFFMKANHASGYNRLVKPTDDPAEITALAQFWLSQSFGQVFHAWAYRDIPRRIVCEKVIHDERGKIPMDIKFYCFHGRVKMVLFLTDRFENQARIFTDENLIEIPGAQMFGDEKMTEIPRFSNYPEMIQLSEKLAEGFNYCRVDFYSVNGQIYFGEITHYTGAGIERFDDFDTDRAFGELWKPENKDKNFFEIYHQIKSTLPVS